MRIAVFDPNGSFFSAPSLQCMLEEFERSGCEVVVYLRTGKENLTAISNVQSQSFPVPIEFWAGDVETTLKQWWHFFKCNSIAGHINLRRERYDLAIGVNPEGVVAAHLMWRKHDTPFVYLSFEMIFMDELKKEGDRRLKRDEVVASRDAALIISQDVWRAELLCAENNISSQKIVFLPVAPRAITSQTTRTTYLRDKYNISNSSTIVINAGTFSLFTRADDVLNSLKSWPSDFCLVVNTHHRIKRRHKYVRQLSSLAVPNVYITEGSMPVIEYEQMLMSADIGLVLYRSLGNSHPFHGMNTAVMGLSSGKLSSYTRLGLPVIIMGNPNLKNLMAEYPFGIYVDDASEIPMALLRIKHDWQCYSDAARRFFIDYLDFNKFWPDVWKEIKSFSC